MTMAQLTPAGIIHLFPKSGLQVFVESQSRQQVLHCYQCGKCTAGCPSAYAMDLGPRRAMRAVQLGLKDEILASSTIWLCLQCQTCSARCPAGIDIASVMESLRLLAAAEKSKPAERDVALFYRLFRDVIRRCGRVYELGLGALYNLLGRHPFANLELIPGFVAKGKLPLLPPRTKGASQVRDIFAKVRAVERKNAFPSSKGRH
jgi:heterodisulfide reductase subunit C